jgi:hypothetical protein
MRRNMLAGTIMAVGAMMLSASMANASPTTPTISIGIVEGGGLPTSAIATGVGSAVATGFIGGTTNNPDFSYTVTAQGSPFLSEPTLDTDSIDVQFSGTAPHSLEIFVTETGLTQPVGLASILSGFTSNTFTGNITSVTESTHFDNGDDLWIGTQLASQTFTTGLDAVSDIDPMDFTGTFSETAEYVIQTSGGSGSVNDTINISDAPEPASLAVLGVGIVGVMFTRRRGFSFGAAA